MGFMYTRDEGDEWIELRVSPWWYVTRYGTLGLAVAYLVFAGALGSVGQSVVIAAFVTCAIARVAGSWSIRRELGDAMKHDALHISGSQWDPRHPLRYAYRRQLPPASVVKGR